MKNKYLNNKGVSLIEMIGVIIVIAVIASIAIPNVSKYLDRSSMATFLTYEKSMEDAAKNGVLECIGNSSAKCDIQEKGNSNEIHLKTLIDEGYLSEIKTKDGQVCDAEKSFVRVENRGNLNYNFKVCLYCDDYITDDDLCKEE